MPNRYRLGVIGFAHMHVNWLLDAFNALPNLEWVACADTIPTIPTLSEANDTRVSNVRRAQSHTGIPTVYEHYEEMLEKEEFDIIIACPENARHGEIAEAVAAVGTHLLTEKPPAASYADAARMVRAVEREEVTLVINWPSTWNPSLRLAKRMIDADEIGEIFEFKWRAGSMGPLPHLSEEERGAEWWHHKEDGGGALLDYCCYGACLSRWLIGESPQAVTGIAANFRSPYGDADDNAALLIRYPGAIGILESSWSTVDHGVSSTCVTYGTKGTIALEQGGVRVWHKKGEGAFHQPDPIPQGRDNVAKELIHHLETRDPLHPTLTAPVNLDAMAILDAGLRSVKSGKLELVHSRYW